MNSRELYQDSQGLYRWRVKGGNGKIIGASSEGFATAASARRNFCTMLGAMVRTAIRSWKAG